MSFKILSALTLSFVFRKTLTSAFTFVTRQTQKAVPSNAFADKDDFEDRIHAANQSLEVLKPEKLEEKLPQGGLPPDSGYLGAPKIPKPPAVGKILPPPEIPKVPVQPLKPEVPLADFQEPMTIEPLMVEGIQSDIQHKNENTEQSMNIENAETVPSWLN